MAFNHGRVNTFSIDDSGGVARDLSAYTESGSITLSGETADTTTYGATGDAKTSIRGLNSGSFSVSGYVDETATTGPNAVLESLYDAVTSATFALQFDGSTTYGGECWLTSLNISGSVGGVNSWSADFETTGVVTRS